MILAWQNLADAAILTASSELATLPGSNVQQKNVARKWQTAAGVKSATLIFDLLSSLSCSALGVLGTNLTSSSTLRLRGSDSDSTGVTGEKYDSTLIASGAKAGYPQAYLAFTAAAARYWRLDLADTTVADNLQVGRVFLGPSWTASIAQGLGGSVTPQDSSKLKRSYGGQVYADERPQQRVVQFTLDFMNEAEMYGNAFAMARATGIVRDVLCIEDNSTSYRHEKSVFGLCKESAPLVNQNLGVYRQNFNIEERL